MRQYNVGYPMESIGLGICGPYPVSKKGNRYLMVVSCYFTKWVDAIPLKSQEAKYVASKLVKQPPGFFCNTGFWQTQHAFKLIQTSQNHF